jgi:3-hydroxymyristoyl/3-hydroxydecanoyl-(acyl carrier protein) dehydratase
MKHFKDNPGFPFILSFEALLLVCAGLLLAGNSLLANDLAILAYYLLLIGLALQFFAFMKERKK